MKTIQIAIADDHPPVADGFAAVLDKLSDIKVVFVANDGKEVMQQLKTRKVDVVLLDLDMPKMTGEETYQQISRYYPEIKVMFITGHFDPLYAIRLIKQNAPAVISKGWRNEKIADAIRTVYRQGEYVDESVYKIIRRSMVNEGSLKEEEADRPDLNLNTLELQTLRLMCLRKKTEEIAEQLGRAKKTIDGHRNNIWRVTGVPSGDIDQLILFALRHKIIALI